MNSMTPQAELLQAIADASVPQTGPTEQTVTVLPEKQAQMLAERFFCRLREIYILAMEKGILPYRYIRNQSSISLSEQVRLARATVAVVGAGGLGGHIVLLLSRIGIGRLIVIDKDAFDETNLNRQALSDVSRIGSFKARAAADTVHNINPAAEVIHHIAAVEENNACDLLQGADVIVDALDNVSGRFHIEDAARKLKVPLVHGALAGFEGQVMTIYPEDNGLKKIYGPREEAKAPPRAPGPEAVLGVPGITPAVVASFQCMEVLKVLLERGRPFRNKFLHLDLKNAQLNIFSFS